jgi:hypothetical protein
MQEGSDEVEVIKRWKEGRSLRALIRLELEVPPVFTGLGEQPCTFGREIHRSDSLTSAFFLWTKH